MRTVSDLTKMDGRVYVYLCNDTVRPASYSQYLKDKK